MIYLIGINLFLYLCASVDFHSIHEVEYKGHLKEATWTVVSTEGSGFKPLQIGTRGMLKNYYGYLPYWIDTLYYQYFQMELLTHISYFSVGIDPATGNLGGIPNASRFYKIRDYGHPRGIRIHMTFTIFGNSNVTTFLNSATARQNAINKISNFMRNYGIEGANIDFEFVTSAVRDSFSRFINDLAYALWYHSAGRKELYLATPAVPEWYSGYDFAYLSSHSDGLLIMAYDYHWSGSTIAGPVSPCVPSSFWGQYCAAKSIGSYKVYGVSGSKIVLDLPYYGYDWPTVSGDIGSSTTGTGSAVIYYYAFQNANTYGRLWDSYSQTPWYRYYTTKWHQCWYDDSVSLDIKFGMVNDSVLQGAGCWALGYDREYNHIWNAIRNNFWVGIEESQASGFCLDLKEPSPNPFKLSTSISYSLAQPGWVRLNVYDVSGRLVRILLETKAQGLGPGAYNLTWDGRDDLGRAVAPGVYFIRMEAASQTATRKLIRLR